MGSVRGSVGDRIGIGERIDGGIGESIDDGIGDRIDGGIGERIDGGIRKRGSVRGSMVG